MFVYSFIEPTPPRQVNCIRRKGAFAKLSSYNMYVKIKIPFLSSSLSKIERGPDLYSIRSFRFAFLPWLILCPLSCPLSSQNTLRH